MNKIFKIFFGLVFFFVFVLVLAIILTAIFFPAEKIKVLIENKASEALGKPVSVGDIGLSFAGIPAIKVSDINIGTSTESKKPLVTVKSVKVKVNILKLLKKEVEIVSVEFDNPAIHLVIPKTDAKMTAQKEDTMSTSGPPSLPLPVTLQTLRIKNGYCEIVNQNNNTRLLVEKMTQILSFNISKDLKSIHSAGLLTVEDISFYPGETKNPVKGLSIQLEHELNGDLTTGTISVTRGDILINELPAWITGEINNWTKSSFEITTGNLSAEKFLKAIPSSLLPEKDYISARGNFTCSINGTVDREPEKPVIEYNGFIDIDDMSLSYLGFPKSLDNITTHIIFSEKDINIKDLSFITGNSSFSLSGIINSYLESPVMSAKMDGKIEMEDITGSLPIFKDRELNGNVEMSLTVQGSPLHIKSMKMDGVLFLRDFVFNLPETLKNPAKLNGLINISPGTLRMEGISMTSGKSDFIFNGELKDYMNLAFPENGVTTDFKGILSSSLIDIDNLIFINKEKPSLKPWDLEEPIKSAPLPPNLSIETTVKLGKVIFGRLKSDSIQGKMILKNGVFECTDLGMSAYNGSLKGRTSITFTDIENVTYNGNLSLQGFDSGEFISDFFGVDNFFRGNLSCSVNFTGAGLDSLSMLKNLKSNGNMRFESGQIVNWDFTKKLGNYLKFLDFDTLNFDTIVNSFIIENQKMFTPDMALKTGHGDIHMDGSIGFDSSVDYTITLLLNKETTQKASKHLSTLASLINKDTESLEIIVKAGGTIKSPEFKIDTSKAEQQLKEELTSKAKKLIEKNIKDEKLIEKGEKLLKRLFK